MRWWTSFCFVIKNLARDIRHTSGVLFQSLPRLSQPKGVILVQTSTVFRTCLEFYSCYTELFSERCMTWQSRKFFDVWFKPGVEYKCKQMHVTLCLRWAWDGGAMLCNCDHRTWIRLRHSTADNRGKSYDTNNWQAHRHTTAYTPQRGTCTLWPPIMYNYVTNTAHLMDLHAME